jgi:hypothetical protein
MNIREFYLHKYPMDELGLELNESATFIDLFVKLIEGADVYEYIGVTDSIIRERLFERIAEMWDISYDFVYRLWINN